MVHGETWALSRKMANEIKMVIMEYISMPQTMDSAKPCSASVNDWSNAAADGGMCGGMVDGLIHDSLNVFPEFDFSLPEENDEPPEWPALDLQQGINV